MTFLDFLTEAIKHGEVELGPNLHFNKSSGRKFYGFSWITGPVFAKTFEELQTNMLTIAVKRNFKPQKKIFIIDQARDELGRFE